MQAHPNWDVRWRMHNAFNTNVTSGDSVSSASVVHLRTVDGLGDCKLESTIWVPYLLACLQYLSFQDFSFFTRSVSGASLPLVSVLAEPTRDVSFSV